MGGAEGPQSHGRSCAPPFCLALARLVPSPFTPAATLSNSACFFTFENGNETVRACSLEATSPRPAPNTQHPWHTGSHQGDPPVWPSECESQGRLLSYVFLSLATNKFGDRLERLGMRCGGVGREKRFPAWPREAARRVTPCASWRSSPTSSHASHSSQTLLPCEDFQCVSIIRAARWCLYFVQFTSNPMTLML
ncbi:hypothetical protein E2C01_050361 [Portunus trituberculatus]|uniref:Uncharacterized protein n=1 Tax=Portunus trituberculatus TaxID=210409 RepID=A0A5B7G8R6_PORTR|nr:hypothetical protein [Portunus trituberculatus]